MEKRMLDVFVWGAQDAYIALKGTAAAMQGGPAEEAEQNKQA